MRSIVLSIAICLCTAVPAFADLVARVDVSRQSMDVMLDGRHLYTWRVSTARKGKWTPRGSWRPYHLSRHHKSSLYNNAPMPYSIFFTGNFAIHGTNAVSRLGRPASAGCVRLHPEHAAELFRLTRQVGTRRTRVVIQD